jgi:hypothetical protein
VPRSRAALRGSIAGSAPARGECCLTIAIVGAFFDEGQEMTLSKTSLRASVELGWV